MRQILVRKGNAQEFEELFLPCLDSAYNLARWLTRNQHDAEDVVQESYLRALQSFDGFQRGRDGKPWLLRIVRNTCYTWLRKNRPTEIAASLDERADELPDSGDNAESALIERASSELVRGALEEIAIEYREVLILRELEGWSYKDIAQIVDVPLGTVMSRLSRGRRELQKLLSKPQEASR